MKSGLAWAQLRGGSFEECRGTVSEIEYGVDSYLDAQIKALSGALIILEKGDLDEAEELIQAAVSEYKECFPTGSPEVGTAYRWFGDLHFAKGEFNKAQRFYSRAEDIFSRNDVITEDRWSVNRSLIKVYGLLGEAKEAIPHIQYVRHMNLKFNEISADFGLDKKVVRT